MCSKRRVGSKKMPRLMWGSLTFLRITFLRAAHISDNTITAGGATGSAASPSTVAVTGAQTTRSAATPEELQAVPPKPDHANKFLQTHAGLCGFCCWCSAAVVQDSSGVRYSSTEKLCLDLMLGPPGMPCVSCGCSKVIHMNFCSLRVHLGNL